MTEIRYLYENALAQMVSEIDLADNRPHIHSEGLTGRLKAKIESALRHDFTTILPSYVRPPEPETELTARIEDLENVARQHVAAGKKFQGLSSEREEHLRLSRSYFFQAEVLRRAQSDLWKPAPVYKDVVT